ncbi:sensor domain-containing diguanylate cyclase [Ruminococcus albus]|uniref:Diguanylate cyclase (GGDEF) domain-containing protein n=2 Tax=Ruminococcus TaxID=1263 RepID=A0A1H7NZY4_RUMAL|nr:diguanylate cyclase [Ruminococcus albus]SEL28889.1 diguanylate cyclase (GGDEF) domain-containing protein [Ruminococcus albus]
MATKKRKPKKLSPITWILIGVLAVMAILITFMTVSVSRITARNAQSNMQTVAAERAKVIEDYVIWAEDTLTNFSHASDVKNLLLNPNDTEAKNQAQKYTSDFASKIGDLEGLYIADWNSKTLTHSNPETVGTIIREGERLDQLHNALLAAGDDTYTAGILISPSSGKQVVAIYRCIYNGSEPIGFVGLAIQSEKTLSDLADMQISGLENASYLLLNTEDNVYIYAPDPSMVGQVCEFPDVQNVNASIISGSGEYKGVGEFKDDYSGTMMLSTYVYLDEYGWTLLFNAPSSEVYSMRNQLQIFILIFGVLILLLVGIFGIINAHQENVNRKLGLQVQKNAATEESLQTAMFQDILTEVQNRVSFSVDIENIQTDIDNPCYCIMFDISELAAINMQFGNDAGDAVLTRTAQVLKEAFPDGKVYRTGDDEFVITILKNDNSPFAHNQVVNEIIKAQSELMKKQDIPDGQIDVAYKIAAVRTADELNTTVIAVLKDMAKHNGISSIGQFPFLDLDSM